MPKVLITQIPQRKDKATGAYAPVVNISPASEHGELTVMMPPNVSFFETGGLVKQLSVYIKDYNYKDGDSIIALGDPAIIATAFALLGKYHKTFKVLKWDRNLGRYSACVVNVG